MTGVRDEDKSLLSQAPGLDIRVGSGALPWDGIQSRKLVRETRAALASLLAEGGDNVWPPLLPGPQRAAHVAIREPRDPARWPAPRPFRAGRLLSLNHTAGK